MLRNTTVCRTASELSGGNADPGAPVTAQMSGSTSCKQGGTVEYDCISHP